MLHHLIVRYWQIAILLFTLLILAFHHFPLNLKPCMSKKSTYEKLSEIDPKELIKPFLMFEKRFRISSALKLNICVIEKNLSTILTAIACYLHNPAAFRNASRNVNNEVFNKRFCKNKNEATKFMGRTKNGLNTAKTWLHISASRDPVERFISGFVDKCMTEKIYNKRPGTCNNCEDNVTCFVEEEYLRMQRFVRGDRVNSFDDRHFFPQNWRCDFAHYFNYYKIIKYSSEKDGVSQFYSQLFTYIRSRNASEEDVRFVENQLYSGRTKHTTSSSRKRKEFEEFVVAQAGKGHHSGQSRQLRFHTSIMLERVLWIGVFVWTVVVSQHRQYYGGVVVPGRSIPTLRFFELYISSCKHQQGKEFSLQKLTNMVKEVDADSIADKIYRDLYFMVDDLDIGQMMGVWYTVIDSPGLHPERCAVSKYELLTKNEYTGTFSTKQYALSVDGKTRVYHGTGEKFGVDPGNIFIYSGQPNDICPYFPTKVGPLNSEANQFEYMVLTQALKHPTIVLARDPREFDVRFKDEVMEYLKRSDFMNPLSALNYPLQIMNTTSCSSANQLYYEPDTL